MSQVEEFINPVDNDDEKLQNIDRNPLRAYFIEIRNIPVLSREEEISLATRAKNGDKKAEKLFITHNLKLVAFIAKKYTGGHTLSLNDLIQEGNIALFEALKGFDPQAENKFSSYAVTCIKNAILDAIREKGTLIRLPEHVGNLKREVYNLRKKVIVTSGCTPTSHEISNRLGVLHQKVVELSFIGYNPMSFDTNFGDESETNLYEIIADEHTLTPEESIDQSRQCTSIKKLLSSNIITREEEEVIKMLYAFDENEEPKTFLEVAEKLKIPLKKVKDTYNRALRKLRKATRGEKKDYFDQK